MTSERNSARDRLLDRVIEFGGVHGLAEHSLRAIAQGAGTSHRMLLHHFGSREELLVAVVKEVEHRQRVAMMDLAAAAPTDSAAAPANAPLTAEDRRAIGLAFWERLSDPSLAPLERLFFELYSQALLGAPWGAELLDEIVDEWVEPVAALMVADGVDPGTARRRARLGVAVSRGLLLDLLATGDRDAVDGAMQEFLRLTG